MFNLSKKKTSTIQLWACVLLTVLALIMSFLPIVKLQTLDHKSEMYELMSDIGVYTDIPEEVDISAVGLIKSGKLIVDLVSTAASDDTEDSDKLDALEEKLKSEDAKKTAMIAIAIVATTADAVSDNDDADSSSGFLSTVFEVLIILGALLGVLGMAIALPITMIVKTIKTAIVAGKNINTPDAAIGSVGSTLASSFKLLLTLMVFQMLIPGMSYGAGLVAIFWIAIVSVVVNTVMIRLGDHTKAENMYLNVVQGASVVGIIGFVVFFFNMIKSNMFGTFLGSYTNYLARVANAKSNAAAFRQDIEINNAYIIDGVLVIACWAILLSTIGYFIKSMSRLSCTKKGGDSVLAGSIFAVVAAVIAKFVAGAKHGYLLLTSTAEEGDYSFLEALTKSEESALNTVLVGAIIMLVVEIALMILKKVLCGDLTKEQMQDLVAGKAVEAVEAAPAEEAPVAEAEEAPVTVEIPAEDEAENK